MEIDFDRVGAELTARGTAELVMPGSGRDAEVPDRWRGVLTGVSVDQRRRAALAYWSDDFLAMIPRFAQVLRERLIDVRVFSVGTRNDEYIVLVYVVKDDGNGYACWIAWDPSAFGGDLPRFWETFPGPVQNFLRRTHAGFTGLDWESYGIMPSPDIRTFAEYGDWPGGVPGWMDGYEDGYDIGYDGERYRRIESTRLVVFTRDGGQMFYCTSPDLPVGQIALVYSGDSDVGPPTDFGTELDKLMMSRLEVQ